MKLLLTAAAGLLLSHAALAQDHRAKPHLVMRRSVEGMPRGSTQEVSVLTAEFKPGDKTVFHTHRFPVTVYVLVGAFTLQLEGHPEVVVKAGEAYVEPPNIKMTGYNRSISGALKVLIFYVADPNTPFLDFVY